MALGICGSNVEASVHWALMRIMREQDEPTFKATAGAIK